MNRMFGEKMASLGPARISPGWVSGLFCVLAFSAVAWYQQPQSRALAADRFDPESRPHLIRPDEPLLPILKDKRLDERKIALGRALFHDVRLSHDNTISCAFCHDLARGGVDHLPRSFGVGGEEGAINTPTVYNASLNFRQFWDGRAASLEEQVDGPLHNPVEMATSWGEILPRLRHDEKLAAQFQAIYDAAPSPDNVRDALAEFERSLVTPSRMDRWLLGENDALNSRELKGYRLFKQYGCIACHQGANVGGNMYQRFGIMKDYFENKKKTTSADMGRFNVTGREEDRHVFKVPSLRNITLTAPYFHDASAVSLHEAVSSMGYYQLGVDLPQEDVQAIVIFLYALTGDELQ
ncbi:MAG: cytochrome-c peroxidase [Zoogloeaceae bacterium]|jgi:cytochrome c peroxidase|nr:cytochrome-c peroxidase [Zoogloeaceae bacterium]